MIFHSERKSPAAEFALLLCSKWFYCPLKSEADSADGAVLAFIQIARIGDFQKYSFRCVVDAFEYDS